VTKAARINLLGLDRDVDLAAVAAELRRIVAKPPAINGAQRVFAAKTWLELYEEVT
jgi:hypothetical protein